MIPEPLISACHCGGCHCYLLYNELSLYIAIFTTPEFCPPGLRNKVQGRQAGLAQGPHSPLVVELGIELRPSDLKALPLSFLSPGFQ